MWQFYLRLNQLIHILLVLKTTRSFVFHCKDQGLLRGGGPSNKIYRESSNFNWSTLGITNRSSLLDQVLPTNSKFSGSFSGNRGTKTLIPPTLAHSCFPLTLNSLFSSLSFNFLILSISSKLFLFFPLIFPSFTSFECKLQCPVLKWHYHLEFLSASVPLFSFSQIFLMLFHIFLILSLIRFSNPFHHLLQQVL